MQDEKLCDAICDAIATQSKGLGAILAELGDPINPSTWYRWLQADSALRERYARARADQAQVMADQIAEIADNTQVGEIITEKADGIEIKRADMIEHRKLRIESRKWLAAKLLPKVYGDKTQQEITGANGGPLQAQITVEFVKPNGNAGD
jgi:hypothetical protein